MSNFLNEFKQFAMRGNVLDMAVFSGLLLYIHWALRIICLTVLPFHFFSDASAWQNAAYPDVPGHILAESALA